MKVKVNGDPSQMVYVGNIPFKVQWQDENESFDSLLCRWGLSTEWVLVLALVILVVVLVVLAVVS